MKFKLLILLVSITMLASCATLQNTTILSGDTSNKSTSLVYVLADDGHEDLADLVEMQEESRIESCKKTDDIAMNNLEDSSLATTIESIVRWFFGEADINKCQAASITLKNTIDDIINKYPQYKDFEIIIENIYMEPDEDSFDDW